MRTAKGRIVAAHLYRRAGDHANAVRLDGLADVLIRTFEHVPLVTALRDHLSDDEDTDSPTSLLVWSMTARQRQVLPYLLSGDSPADIAERLHISVNTLNGHLQAIYGRLRVSSRAAAAARLSSIDLTRFDDTTTADASGPTTG